MKNNYMITLLGICGILAFAAGCGEQESTPPPAGNTNAFPTNTVAQKQMEDSKAKEIANAETMRQQAVTNKLNAEKDAENKITEATAAADREQVRIAGLIGSANSLTEQGKYTEAVKILGELSNLQLSPEQQILVDELRKTVEKEMAKAAVNQAADGAVSAVDDVLQGKK